MNRVVSIQTVTNSGSVSAGAQSVEFILSTDFAGTICGETFSGADDYSVPFEVKDNRDNLPEIPYTISAGSLRIKKVA